MRRTGSHTSVAVLRRLDIDPDELEACPKVSDILIRCLGTQKSTKLPRQAIFNYISASGSPCAVAFLRSMKDVKKSDLDALSFEAMCVRARVSPLELLGAILMSAKSMKATESALRAIMAHPDVVQTTVETAKIPGPAGFSDRKMLHEAVGFLPTKKGGDFNINFGFGRPAEERGEDPDGEDAWDDTFPPLGEQIQQWSSDKHKLLEAENK